MNKLKMLGVSVSVILTTSMAFANKVHQVKHLAGPAEEIELMQKASPESTAIVSKHAMIGINMSADSSGKMVWQKDILIDGDNPKVLLFSPEMKNWQMSIKAAGEEKNSNNSNIDFSKTETNFGMSDENFPATQFDFQNLKSGRYELDVSAEMSEERDGFLLLSSDSPYRLKSYVSSAGQLVGDFINLNALATTDEAQFTVVKNDLQLINSSYMRITAPDGNVSETSMFDDGMAADKVASDGEFNGGFIANQPGLYQVQVISQGITPTGKPFYRTAEHVIPVINSDLVLNSKTAEGKYSNEHKIDLEFSVDTAQKDARYRVMAEVWGTQKNAKSSEMTSVSWLSTIVELKDGKVSLQLDDRWLIDKDVQAPFALKNIRVEDLDHYISVLNIGNLPLVLPTVSAQSKSSYDGSLIESMLKGERPASLNNDNKAAGGKLMLVHGYCSGDAWGPVKSQFSNSVKFTDYNQNRSHDAFARLIDTYGDNYPSFGVVAHSQGGAASLHLYTYYWSGLDSAGSGRLIQSVGTPYQGTPLAGNLAALGSVFGVGCGYNSDLTTSGASSWLSGIPTWARNKVNYYTTSFSTKWWRNDYCNIASDLVLSDPEDGTTEKSRGQLSGAVNQGHKTGQCHTEGMRDMAQTRDSSRNSSMSANAAR